MRPAEEIREEDADEDGDDMKLTSLQSITDFMTCAEGPFLTISVFGQEETWQLPIPMRFHRKNAVTHRELYPL